MNKVFLCISAESYRAGRPHLYQYAQIWQNGDIRLVDGVEKATTFESQQDAKNTLQHRDMWICEYDGETVKPLQPTR